MESYVERWKREQKEKSQNEQKGVKKVGKRKTEGVERQEAQKHGA